jgi:hypothetical protein
MGKVADRLRPQRAGMAGVRGVCLMGCILALAGCTADPNAPINQTFPIRQMDDFFRQYTGSPSPTPNPVPETTRQPGYAPAYPPYRTEDDGSVSVRPPAMDPPAPRD